jgi:hypothetical protein
MKKLFKKIISLFKSEETKNEKKKVYTIAHTYSNPTLQLYNEFLNIQKTTNQQSTIVIKNSSFVY